MSVGGEVAFLQKENTEQKIKDTIQAPRLFIEAKEEVLKIFCANLMAHTALDREVLLLLALTVDLREVAEVERMAAPGCNKPFISD